jgi:hypothetical protein
LTDIASPTKSSSGEAAGQGMTPEEETSLPEARRRLLERLAGSREPLFAILDAARDLRALNWLKDAGEEHQSLYDGESAVNLEMFAPYLVRFQKPSAVLQKLVAQAWGRAWGVYLTSAASLPDLRKHFRHFLMAEIEGGKTVYFRFYDPRVLRVYLPTCTPEETRQFFGPVGSFLMEDADENRLLRFQAKGGLEREEIPLEGSYVPRS